jgi:hypothetical protein
MGGVSRDVVPTRAGGKLAQLLHLAIIEDYQGVHKTAPPWGGSIFMVNVPLINSERRKKLTCRLHNLFGEGIVNWVVFAMLLASFTMWL